MLREATFKPAATSVLKTNFCKSATFDDIRHHGYILTPGRYVGAAEVEDVCEPFEEKMARLTAELRDQAKQAAKLDKLIWANLKDIGYGE